MNDLDNKVILTVAPTGAWPSKGDTPHIPLQPEEIAEEIYDCWQAGASIAHIHVRDDDDKSSMDFDKFTETVELIRATDCDIVLNLTTSGQLGLKDEDRMKHIIALKPELASYDCGSMNWAHSTVFENSPRFLEKLGMAMQDNNIKPEIEIFDAGMVYNALYYLKKGILKAPLHFQFVLGAPGGMTATVENLMFLKTLIPADSTWGALGIGRGHLPIMYTTLALGGHVRVGMEDNIYYSKGVLAKSNVDFVERTKRIAAEIDKEIATPDEAREILSLSN
ncbi:MAG: 3-keto-5-aminohexanoate cleavage protein [Desulfofustis sp.]|nr:3-keto-5-aminohexanoate cleavage protein [Desulfofustis sp.]MBT8345106.1 3-keto-5-aminohexanoate cleavage protein [Desulfofustis sp.]NNK14934.1 3-keto-5-aminohexanoate cleavage protein [Desulfofustis sp.]NNK56299.1 3-keto-5-aminohexanoate cleavage protein [Desulfofustis sp.]